VAKVLGIKKDAVEKEAEKEAETALLQSERHFDVMAKLGMH